MESGKTRQWHGCRTGIGVVLAAVVLLSISGDRLRSEAGAQLNEFGTAEGVIVECVPLSVDSYGIVMVDTLSKRLWVYEVNNRASSYNRLRLIAARRWEYDSMLDEYNTGEPRPVQVKEMLERLKPIEKKPEVIERELTEMAEPEGE